MNWNGPEWVNLIQMTNISTTVGNSLLEEMDYPHSQQKNLDAVLGCNLKNDRMISVCFQGKPFNITVIQVYAPTTNAKKLKLNGSVKTYKTF